MEGLPHAIRGESRRSGRRVIVHAGGGLGNQLFQYAFGRQLAIAHAAELWMDASGYPDLESAEPTLGIRALALPHFAVHCNFILKPAGIRQPRAWLARKILKQWNKAMRYREGRKPYYMRREVWEPEENHFKYDRRLLERPIKGTVHFFGYWQTEKYFLQIADLLRRELVVKDPPAGKNEELARLAQSGDSVSVHVRHGDNAGVAAALGVLPLAYYRRAITALRHDIPDARFFVFSDDPEWAHSNLVVDADAVYVSHNGDAGDYEDLRLMSLCRHHICANSTFSWWGAWLGKKPGQLVYAPRRYYQNIDRPNPDLYPEDWRLI
jgi:hypothetical protein